MHNYSLNAICLAHVHCPETRKSITYSLVQAWYKQENTATCFTGITLLKK